MHGHLEIPGLVETEEESFRSRDQRTYFLLHPYLTISTAGLGHQELPGCFAFVGAPLNSSASLPILVPFKTWNDSGGFFFQSLRSSLFAFSNQDRRVICWGVHLLPQSYHCLRNKPISS